MVTKTTHGITISVIVQYQPDMSDEARRHFMFSYRIRIANLSGQTVQLVSRHWNIWDSDGERRVVEGPGVVGQQPLLKHGESFEYTSGCNLKTGFGTMEGYYTMQIIENPGEITAAIPAFQMIAPSIQN